MDWSNPISGLRAPQKRWSSLTGGGARLAQALMKQRVLFLSVVLLLS
jgi:hypothetical protein